MTHVVEMMDARPNRNRFDRDGAKMVGFRGDDEPWELMRVARKGGIFMPKPVGSSRHKEPPTNSYLRLIVHSKWLGDRFRWPISPPKTLFQPPF